MSDYKLAIKIAGQLDSSLTSAVNQAQNMLNGLNGGRGKGIGQTVFGGLASGAKTLAKSSVASLGMIGAGAIKVGKDAIVAGQAYEQATSQLAATMAVDKTDAGYLQLESTIRELGRTTNFTATEAAEAANILAMSGYTAEDSIAALPTVLQLAGAGALEMEDSAAYLTSTLASMGIDKTEENFSHLADVMAEVATLAKTDVAGLGEAFNTIGANGAALSGGVEEMAALVGVLGNVNIEGAEAGTHIRNIVMSLQNPRNKNAAKMFKDLGVKAYDAEGKMRPVMDIMSDMNSAMDGWTDEQRNAAIADMFKLTDQAAVKALLAGVGDEYNKLYDAAMHASDGIGAAKQMYKSQMDNLQGDIDLMKSAWEGFGLEIYNAIVGGEGTGLRGAVQDVTGIIEELQSALSTDGFSGLATEIGNVIGDISAAISTNGGQALKDAQEFASDLINSLGSETNAAKIGEAGATIIGGLAEGFLTYTGDFGVAAGNIMMNLAKGFNEQDVGAKIGEAAKTMVTKLGDWFQQNKEDLGTTAGNLITGLVEGISKNAGDLLVGGIDIVEGIAEGVVQAGFVLASHAPEIVGDLVNGIIDAIPRFFNAGVALISAVIDGIWSLGEAAGQALYDALTMVDVAPEMEEIFDPGIVDVYAEHVDAVNEKMIELASGTNLTGLQTELLEGQTTLQEVMETMSNMEIDSPEYMEMAQDVQGYIDIMKSAMDELGIEYQQAEQTVEEASSGISESTQAAMDAATEGLTSGAETAATTMQEELNNLRAEAASTGAEVEEALNVDLASTMNADALSTIIESIDAGSIDQLTAAFDTAMTSMTTSANAASTSVMASMLAMTASFAAMAVAVGVSNAAVLLSCNLTAAGITSAFASVNLSGIAANMMAGLTQGIIAGGQQALAAARSIASQIAAVMSSALSIHSPSKVTYEIGSYVGAGLENALYDSQPGVESASAALAGSVVGGQTDTLSGTFGAVSSVGSAITGASAAGGESSGGNITYSPQITIAGNASQQDVQNALSWGMGEFEKMYDRLMKDRRRTAFA